MFVIFAVFIVFCPLCCMEPVKQRRLMPARVSPTHYNDDSSLKLLARKYRFFNFVVSPADYFGPDGMRMHEKFMYYLCVNVSFII